MKQRSKVAVSMPTSWVCGDLLVARLRVGEFYFSAVAAIVALAQLEGSACASF